MTLDSNSCKITNAGQNLTMTMPTECGSWRARGRSPHDAPCRTTFGSRHALHRRPRTCVSNCTLCTLCLLRPVSTHIIAIRTCTVHMCSPRPRELSLIRTCSLHAPPCQNQPPAPAVPKERNVLPMQEMRLQLFCVVLSCGVADPTAAVARDLHLGPTAFWQGGCGHELQLLCST